jgi:CRP/FNR family cyclic AMP-dependent transcriptional regulator
MTALKVYRASSRNLPSDEHAGQRMNTATEQSLQLADPAQLRRIPLLAEITESELQRVATDLRVRAYARRETVIHKGSPGSALLLLLSGQLQVVDVTEDGRAVGLRLLNAGDFFGELAVIDGGPRSATVTALNHAVVGSLPRPSALWLFSHCPSVASRMLSHMAAKLRNESQFRMLLGIQNTFQRVCALLEFYKRTQPGGLEVVENLPTQQDIAIMINTSRETVSRVLGELIQRGIVEKDMRRLIIRRPQELGAIVHQAQQTLKITRIKFNTPAAK